MFKNFYNTNTILFSPDGQLLQLDFAKKASERGNLSLSLKSKNYSILMGTIKSEKILSNRENRFLTFGNNFSIITTGISKDAKFLNEIIKKKKNENENSSNRSSQIPEIAIFCSKIISRNTYYFHMRPFGIKLIMIGYDSVGPCIFDFDADGNFQRRNFSVQGKNSNKILSYMEEFESENFSVDELVIKIISIYSESIKESEKIGVDKHSFLLSLIGKNLELVVLNEKIIEFYLNIFQQRGVGFCENNSDLGTTSKNVDFESTSDWSNYESDPCLIENCSLCYS